MKILKIVLRYAILSMLFFVVFIQTQTTFAYWAQSITGNNNQAQGLVLVGEWLSSDAPEGIPEYNPQDTYATGDLVWFEGAIYQIRNGGYSSTPPDQNPVYGPYNEITNEWRITNTYADNDDVYYQGAFYKAINSGQANGAQLNTVGWSQFNSIEWSSTKASYTTNDIVLLNGELYRATAAWTTGQPDQSGNWEKIASFDWSPTRIYSTSGILVFYNGNYYTSNWYNQNVEPGNGGPWSLANIQTWGNKNFALNAYALHNGALYQAIGGNNGQRRNSEPGTLNAFGIWKRVDTQVWQQFNQYTLGEYVLYNGDVYQVANVANAEQTQPGTQYNAWNKVNTSEWQSFNVYQTGDYVYYDGNPYQVADQNLANNNVIPGSVNGAFSRLDTYNWFSFNMYVVDDIVIHNSIAYEAILQSINIEPGTTGSETYWQIYSN